MSRPSGESAVSSQPGDDARHDPLLSLTDEELWRLAEVTYDAYRKPMPQFPAKGAPTGDYRQRRVRWLREAIQKGIKAVANAG